MSLPEVVSRDEWLVARQGLLAEEKELTAPGRAERRTPAAPDGRGHEGVRLPRPGGRGQAARPIAGRRETTLAYVSRAPWRRSSATRRRRAGRSPGTRRTAATSTTTSASRSTSRLRPRVQLPPLPGRGRLGAADGDAGDELLPARRRPRLPHVLDVRPRRRADRRLVLLARSHRPGPPGGVGGAEGPRGGRARRRPGLSRPDRETRRGGASYRTTRKRRWVTPAARACASALSTPWVTKVNVVPRP